MYRMASAAVTTDTGLNLSASYTYEDDLLTKIQTASTTYNFTYGNFGLRSSVKVGTQALATYSYTQDGNNYLSSLDYGNGDKVQYEYDHLGRVTKQTYEDGDTVTYKYDNSGALATVEDSATGRKTTYYYDFTDRLMKYVETGTDYYHSVGYEYDQLNNLTSLVETINGTDYTTSYAYDDDNRVASVTTNGTTVEYTYDAYGRISQQVTKRGDTTILTETYTYVGTDISTSSRISTYKTETANYRVTYSYTFDDNGNVLSVTESIVMAGNAAEYVTTYEYDSANQLIRENNQRREQTFIWTYDNAGNILEQTGYAYTTGVVKESTFRPALYRNFSYTDEDWGDLLTTYNNTEVTYDEIGNPSGYGIRSFTWEHGRQLAAQTRNGIEWEYTYGADGLCIKSSSDSRTYKYVYSGDKLVQMTITKHTTNPETVQLVELSYDAAGQPLTMTLDGVIYYYVLNFQGDVVGMVDGNGNLQMAVNYNGYGAGFYYAGVSNMMSTLSGANPLGYRGYVMDSGTGLYYLQSRYYDPEIGRFINADAYTSTGQGLLGNNMFAYCLNNPACRKDISGTTSQEIFNGESDLDSTDDDQEFAGGKMSSNSSGGAGSAGNTGSTGSTGSTGGADGSGVGSTQQGCPNYNGPANETGPSKAPEQGEPGSAYTQVSSDGKNTVRSITVYGEQGMPAFRIDYDHSHGTISGPHIHYFTVYAGPNGFFLNRGPVVAFSILE